MAEYRYRTGGALVQFRQGVLVAGWHLRRGRQQAKSWPPGYREKIAAVTPARECMDGQQVFAGF